MRLAKGWRAKGSSKRLLLAWVLGHVCFTNSVENVPTAGEQ